MNTNENYYKILGVNQNASENAITEAYCTISSAYHPNKNRGNPEAEKRFKLLTEAYLTLTDPQRRRKYDMYGRKGEAIKTPGTFTDFFFNKAGPHKPIKIPDFIVDLKVSLEDIYCNKTIRKRIIRSRICECCDGTGSSRKRPPIICCECRGTAVKMIKTTQDSKEWFQPYPCERCKRTGKIMDTDYPCKECNGTGIVRASTFVSIKLKEGMKNGTLHRLKEEGDEYPGTLPGDIVLKIVIVSGPYWQCNGYDMVCTVKISLMKSLCGHKLELRMPDGEYVLKDINNVIPPNSSIIIKNKGLKNENGIRGDLKVIFEVEYPSNERVTLVKPDLRKMLKDLFGEL